MFLFSQWAQWIQRLSPLPFWRALPDCFWKQEVDLARYKLRNAPDHGPGTDFECNISKADWVSSASVWVAQRIQAERLDHWLPCENSTLWKCSQNVLLDAYIGRNGLLATVEKLLRQISQRRKTSWVSLKVTKGEVKGNKQMLWPKEDELSGTHEHCFWVSTIPKCRIWARWILCGPLDIREVNFESRARMSIFKEKRPKMEWGDTTVGSEGPIKWIREKEAIQTLGETLFWK